MKFKLILIIIIVISAASFANLFAAEKSINMSANLPEPIKNLINSFSGANIWSGIKSVFSSIDKFAVEKFNLNLEKIFKALVDVIIWIFAKLIDFLKALKSAF